MSEPQRPGQQAPWPEQYNRAGETEWIPRVQDAPRRDEPLQFQEQAPAPASTPALTWALRAAGLVAVAFVSGLLWWYIQDDGTPTTPGASPTTQRPSGLYEFTAHEKVPQPRIDRNCSAHAYGTIKEFLTPAGVCEKVTQALYTTEVDGRAALVSVSVVHMSTPELAAELRSITDRTGTGNVSDLVVEGVVKVPGLKSLANGYAARQDKEVVVIVESDFVPAAGKTGGDDADESTLDKVCADALRLGAEIDSGA